MIRYLNRARDNAEHTGLVCLWLIGWFPGWALFWAVANWAAR